MMGGTPQPGTAPSQMGNAMRLPMQVMRQGMQRGGQPGRMPMMAPGGQQRPAAKQGQQT